MTIQSSAQRHEFFAGLPEFLDGTGQEYRNSTSTDLLVPGSTLDLLKKPFGSMVEKCFRKNVLLNRDFPAPPKDGWVTTKNCTEKLNDLVRGTLVCRYVDGPDFLATRLKTRATAVNLKAHYYPQHNDRGYYAFHYYVRVPTEILDNHWNASTVDVQIEIQLSTQLQEVLRALTHGPYEQLRLKAPAGDDGWQWAFGTHRFKSSYLGHTLHLIEGMIVELRRETLGKGSGVK